MKRILILFFLSSILISCQKQIDKQTTSKTWEEKVAEKFGQYADEISQYSIEEVYYEGLGKLKKEKVALLSLKYNIDEHVMYNILDEYLSKHDLKYNIFSPLFQSTTTYEEKSAFEPKGFKETIGKLSIKYNIPENKLASIIIDYRIWGLIESKTQEE